MKKDFKIKELQYENEKLRAEIIKLNNDYTLYRKQLLELKDKQINTIKEDYNKKISQKGTIRRLLDALVERIEFNTNTDAPTLNYVESFEKLYKLYKEDWYMIIQKIKRSLTNLESMCTFCSRYVNIEKDDYVATYSRRQYKNMS